MSGDHAQNRLARDTAGWKVEEAEARIFQACPEFVFVWPVTFGWAGGVVMVTQCVTISFPPRYVRGHASI